MAKPSRSTPARRTQKSVERHPDTPCELVQKLRLGLGLSSEGAAARSDGAVSATNWRQIESRRNKVTSYACRLGVAKALGLTLEELEGLFTGKITVEKLLEVVCARDGVLAASRASALAKVSALPATG